MLSSLNCICSSAGPVLLQLRSIIEEFGIYQSLNTKYRLFQRNESDPRTSQNTFSTLLDQKKCLESSILRDSASSTSLQPILSSINYQILDLLAQQRTSLEVEKFQYSERCISSVIFPKNNLVDLNLLSMFLSKSNGNSHYLHTVSLRKKLRSRKANP